MLAMMFNREFPFFKACFATKFLRLHHIDIIAIIPQIFSQN